MKRRSIVLLVLVFAVGLLAGQGLSQTPPPAKRDGRSGPMVLVPTSAVAPLPEGLTPEEKRDIEVFRRAQGSVVFITSIGQRLRVGPPGPRRDQLPRDPGGQRLRGGAQRPVGMGGHGGGGRAREGSRRPSHQA